MLYDLRQALRIFSRSPGFALAVILTMAISIGAVTTVFGIANNVLFRPLPYPDFERLMLVDNSFMDGTNAASFLDVREWKDQQTSFEAMAELDNWSSVNLTDGDSTERVRANYVGGEFFELLGAETSSGRTFSTEESLVPGTEPVAVMSHNLWQNRYGGQEIVGQTISIQGHRITIVGVMSDNFKNISDDAQLWLPITMMPVLYREDALNNRSVRLIQTVARLKDGVTREQAQVEMDAITEAQQKTYPDTNTGYGATVRPLFEFIYYEQQELGDIKQSLLILALGSGFLLLLACVNLGSLFLVRGIQRSQEFAVRLAMGIKRRQLVRLLIIESFILIFTAGLLGLLFANWSQAALMDIGRIDLPNYVNLGIDGRILLFTALTCTVATLVFCLWPAIRSTNPDLRKALQTSSRRSGGGKSRASSALVVAEVALAAVLLIGASLMIRSFDILQNTSIGFDTENLLTARARLTGESYAAPQDRINLATRLSESLSTLPGVQASGIWGAGLPGGSGGGYLDLLVDGRAADRPEDNFRARNHHLVPGALRAVGIPILRGRDIAASDTLETPLVALISQATAEALFPGDDPIGKNFRVRNPSGPLVEVVGLVPDLRHAGRIGPELDGDIYVSYFQRPVRSMGFFLKTAQDPATLAPTLRKLMKSLDPDIAVYEVETARQRMQEEEAELRMSATLMSFYSFVAMVLACIGIYSVMAYSVKRRTHEIGVRLAFGAEAQGIRWMILRRALSLVVVGLVLGLGLAFLLTRVIQSMLFGISSTDPMVFLLVPIAIFALAFLASWLPTRRALSIEPVSALRYD